MIISLAVVMLIFVVIMILINVMSMICIMPIPNVVVYNSRRTCICGCHVVSVG